ncbi:putative Zinc finger, RING-type [Septoria linicola]|nr:putative Zinc finger, RING-type [Septoria linicola]
MDGINTSYRTDHATPKKALDACTICLEPISERAVATPCNHLSFDFLCLVSWLQEQSSCPLCKAEIKEVQYDWRSPDDYKTYHVLPKDVIQPNAPTSHQPYRRPAHPSRRTVTCPIGPPVDDILERRRRVYRDRLYSLHIGANRISQYKDFTQRDFLTSDELQTNAKMFLRRELKVFDFLDNNPRASSRDFLLVYIIFVLKSHELRGADGRAEDLVAEFLGRENASLLLHEMESWLRSPYTMLSDWDGEVQYPRRNAQGIVKRDHG